MKKLTIESLPDEYENRGTSTYLVPTVHEALKQSKATWDKQYDSIERKMVEGGLPVLWAKVLGQS
jgi:hypothetical protein